MRRASAAARVVVPVDPIAQARARLGDARQAVAGGQREVDASREREKASRASAETPETDAAILTVRRERAEARHVQLVEEERAAAAHLQELETAAAREEKVRAIEHHRALPSRLMPLVERLVDVRAQVYELREQIADVVADDQRVCAAGFDLATALGETGDWHRQVPRAATLDDALTLVRVALAVADREARRDPCDAWCDAEDLDVRADDARWRPIQDALRVLEAK